MIGRKKKIKRVTLYKKFLADQENEKKAAEEKPVCIEKEKKSKKEKKKIEVPYSIAICSLREGSGCSHFTLAFAKYLQKKNKRVFVITNNSSILDEKNITSGKEYIDGFYDHIVYDFGCLRDMDFQELRKVQLCQEKIMICQLTQVYLQNLANFIESKIKFSQSWTFLFNFVPQKKEKEVHDLMEDYKYGIIPIFSVDESKVVENVLREVWI